MNVKKLVQGKGKLTAGAAREYGSPAAILSLGVLELVWGVDDPWVFVMLGFALVGAKYAATR